MTLGVLILSLFIIADYSEYTANATQAFFFFFLIMLLELFHWLRFAGRLF